MAGLLKDVLKGSAWITVSKWFVSISTIASTMILARLLTPEDFGIVAAATLFTGFCEILSRLGTEQYLIQKTQLDEADIQTSWTIQLLAKLGVALAISFCAAAVYFVKGEGEIAGVLLALSLIPILDGLKSIGLVLLKKEMKFKAITIAEIFSKLLSTVLLIGSAYYFVNYWAFVIGSISYFAIFCVMSYFIAPYTLSPTLKNFNTQFSFSKWTLLTGALNYGNKTVNRFFITFKLGVVPLGSLNLASRLVSMPQELVLSPFSDAVFPAFAKVKNDNELFERSLLRFIFFIVTLSSTISVAMFTTRYELVDLFLGDIEKWYLIPSLIGILVWTLPLGTLTGNLTGCLTIFKDVRFLFHKEVAIFLFLVCCLFGLVMFVEQLTVFDFILVSVCANVCNTIATLIRVSYKFRISFGKIILRFICPIACSLIGYTIFLQISPLLEIGNVYGAIILKSVLVITSIAFATIVTIGLSGLCKSESQYFLLNLKQSLLTLAKRK